MSNYKGKSDREIHDKAIGKKHQSTGWIKKISIVFLSCILALTLATPMLHADDLEIGPEIVGQPVSKAVKAPTVNAVLYDATTISGANLAKDRINKQIVIATVHVTLKDKDGTVKAAPKPEDVSVDGTTWTVNLPAGVKVAEGDTVTVYQQIGADKSPEVTKTAQPSKASTVTLTMPSGEIWIEQTSSNIVNKDEQAEAVQMLKDANTEIAGDIKSVKFSIDGTDHAYYEVTYKDGSTPGKVEATNLQIKQVTEHSRGATLGSITIVDNVIKGKLAGEGPFDGIKVQIILKLSDAVKDSYCDGGKCLTDKDTSKPVDATVNGTTGEFSYTIPNDDPNHDLQLDQVVGVTVKEPHKFKSCSKTTVKPVIVGKTEVRDPRKLTSEDKKAIDAAIRKGYTVNGVSKLPNGTGDWDGVPAVIQIDDSGNVKIFSGNDVKGDWDNDGNFIPEKNEDGSLKVNEGAEPKITIPAKDLLKNIKPDAPTVALSEDKKSITITPNEKDTDAQIIAVSYKDKDGKDQTTTATKADDGTWSIAGEGTVVNGVITLPKNKVKGETVVTATVTDKGGIADDDKNPLTSDPGTLTVKETKADKVKALGGLDPVVMKKWVKDEVDWKEGVKAKDSATDENKAKIKEFLDEAKTTFADENSRGTTAEGDFTGKIKVTFDDGSEIIVEKQMLYVRDLVSPSDKENLPDDAIDVELKLGEGVKAGDKTGNKETPVTAKTYKVKPGTDLSKEKVSKTEKTCFEDVGATVSDATYVDVTWNDKDKGTNFKATAENNVFTATATKTYKVTVVPNGGKGTEIKDTKKTGETYKLPAKDTFTPPDDTQVFDTWEIDGQKVAAGTEITVTKDTVVKALWKKIQVKVTYDANGGKGTMEGKTLDKGSKYTVLPNGFTAPDDTQEFKAWEVDGQEVAPGAKITVTKDTVVKALWKKIQVKVTYDANGGKGTMEGKTLDKGSTYKVLASTFTAPENQEFKTWEIDGREVAAGTDITVTKDTVVKAIWKDIMVDINFEPGEGSGAMNKETVKKGSTFKLPPSTFKAPENKELKGWKIGEKEYQVGDEITVSDNTTVTALWKKIQVKVTYDANGGKGTMDGTTLDKGSEYTVLPNAFTAPDDTQEFDTWEVNGEKVAPGTKIKADKDTVIKAVWKKIPVTVTYNANGGSGEMKSETVDKGSEYTVLPNGFTAPDDTQEFKAWEVDGQEVAPGAKITVKDNTVVKAVWKKIQVKVSYNANGGSGEMTGATLDKGTNYTVLPNAFKAPANKKFDTWEIDGKRVAAGTEIIVAKDTEVKALWKSIGKPIEKDIMVKITYDPNGGHWNNDSAKKTIEVKKGTRITIMDAPAWSGYTFQYWKGSEYQPGDSYTANEDHTFVAQWKPTPKPPVTPPDNPNAPGTPNTPAKPGTKAPKTGDASALSLFASGILAAGGAIALLKKRREER